MYKLVPVDDARMPNLSSFLPREIPIWGIYV